MAAPFGYAVRVRYAECDAQGVVFNAHYLAYMDLAITELWRAAVGGYRTMLDAGLDIVVAEAQLRFRGSARFDDQLTLEVAVAHLGNTSLITEHRIAREGDELVTGTLRHVMVQRDSLAKTPIPDWLREGLRPWVAEA